MSFALLDDCRLRRRVRFLAVVSLAFLSVALGAGPALAQIIQQVEPTTTASVRFGAPVATKYRVGAKIVAKGASVTNIRLMVAVPLECAEQEAHALEEDFSPHVEGVEFRLLPPDNGARQMLITIPNLPARQEAHAYITYEVLTKSILPPEETASLRAPRKPDRVLKHYLSASKYIDVNHRKIRDAVRAALAAKSAEEAPAVGDASPAVSDDQTASPGYETVTGSSGDVETAAAAVAIGAVGDSVAKAEVAATDEAALAPATSATPAAADAATNDWQRVEALYDYAIEHVKYEEGIDKSSVQVLKEGRGDCQAIAALFVAMCRTEKVPARLVWVDAHQYAEFYLEDEAGKGHWYPVESAGTRAFGEMPIARVILQKGDNFRVPERRGERLRYASDYALLLSPKEQQPKVTYVREQL